MKAGPRNGSTARIPRCWPLSERSAALSTRSSPGSACSAPSTCRSAMPTAVLTALTATLTNLLDENRARQAERNVRPVALDANGDRAFELALAHDLHRRAGQQATPVQLAEADRVVVRHALHDDLLPHATLAERAVAQRAHLACEGRDGVAVRVELRAA